MTKRSNMKVLLLFLFAVTLLSCQPGHSGEETTAPSEVLKDSISSGYDAALARDLGADAYGMKTYIMAFLKRGPKRSADSTVAANLQRAHLDNITRLVEEGKMVMAGPFLDDGDVRGIYIFDVATIEEARKLTETDPAIKAGSLVMELRPWYGSAALKEMKKVHERIQEKDI